MNNRDTRFDVGGQSFCLGDIPHLAEWEDEVCRTCGALVQDTLLGSYQMKRLLGSGRSGQAYLAVQQRVPQPVVVKVLPPDPTSQHLWESAWREANQLAALRHRSILPVLSCTLWNPKTHTQLGFMNKTADMAYLAMVCQYAPVTLYTLFSPGGSGKLQALRLSIRHLLHLILQAAAALSLAHDLGIAHGALVPGNFLLTAQLDQLWIADFGLARLHPPPAPFLAPELVSVVDVARQRRDMTSYWEGTTAASDQFAFAVVCYQFFVRAMPPDVVERVMPVIQRASQPDPAQRFPRIADFVNALATMLTVEQFSPGEPAPQLRPNNKITSPIQENRDKDAHGFPPTEFSPTVPLADKRLYNTAPIPAISPTTTGTRRTASQWEQVAGRAFTSRNYDEAEQAYLQATRMDPALPSGWLGLGDTYFALERYPDALGAYGKALDLDPNNSEAWFNRGTVLDVLGRADQAALDYERAEQLRAEALRRSQ